MTEMSDTHILARRVEAALSSASAFAALARSRLDREPAEGGLAAGGRSDFDLNPSARPPAHVDFRRAAVLVPVMARDTLTVLLTRRADNMKHHAGQVSFPGGRIDDEDADAAAAALREAAEEIGIERARVEPLGFLDTYRTGTGFAIAPLVGIVAADFTPVLQTAEVAEVFEVPLAFLMDPANLQTHTRELQGIDRRYYAMPWQERYIWGATAGMLKNLQERLFLT